MTEPRAGRSSERQEAATGAGLASFGVLISGVFTLLLLPVLTRTLTPTELGLFLLVNLIQSTIGALLPLGLPAGLAYFVPRRGDPAARALGFWTGVILFLLAIPAALALILAAPLVASDPDSIRVVRLLGLYVLADLPGQALPAYLLARRAYRGFFGATLLFAVSRFASLAIPAALGASVAELMAWFLIVAGLRLALFLWYFLAVADGSLSRSHVHPRELFALGLPLSMATLVGKLNVQADKYLMAAVSSKAVFGVYTVGAVELPLVDSLAYSVTNALVPSLTLAHARGDTSGFLRLWHGSIEKVAVIMMPVFFYFLLLADAAIQFLFSAQFAAAAVPFRVYLMLLPLRLCGYGSVLRSLGETRAVFTASVVGLVVNALLMYPLYRLFGLAGPALAAVLALAATIAVLLGRIRAVLGIAWREVMPWERLALSFVVAALAAVPLFAVIGLTTSDGARLAAGALIMLPFYLWIGRRTGVVAAGDLRYLGRLLSLKPLWERRSAARGGEV